MLHATAATPADNNSPGKLENLFRSSVAVSAALNHLPDAVALVRVVGHRPDLQLVYWDDCFEPRSFWAVSARLRVGSTSRRLTVHSIRTLHFPAQLLIAGCQSVSM